MNAAPAHRPSLKVRSAQLWRESQDRIVRRTDRLFAHLFVFQWIAVIIVVLATAPLTWSGDQWAVHPHVWAAVFLGAAILAGPVLLAWRQPGTVATRHIIAVGQMLTGAMFIHLSDGRIEMHFHVFGSLAFLAFYRDPKVLLTASVTVALDHFVRGVWLPQSVFGVATASPWRVLEHAAWVIFEDVFLIISIRQSRAAAAGAARHQAQVEAITAEVEERVAQRTAELHRSEEHARSILSTAYDGFVEIDSRGGVVDWNPRATEMFGWSRAQAIGQPLSDLIVPAASRGKVKRVINRYLATGQGPALRRSLEFTALRRDGSEFPAEITIWSVQRESGWGFNAFVHDITERRRAEIEAERARVSALESARLKSEFLANMSHEIRTPMNGVMGMLNLLADTPLDAQQREFAHTARSSAESLLTVLNDILDFSKIEAGKLTFEERDFDLREVVEGTLELLAGSAQAKGLELIGVIEDASPTALRGDSLRLRQVLLNLLGNAIKFTERGEVVLRARVAPGPEGLVAHFEVSDTGIGIAAEVLPRLFHAFSQADGSTTRRYGGSGLGLAISRRLVELMQGEISVSSAPGRGSTFRFHARLHAAATAAIVARRAGLAGRRVLIVDDNATNRAVLRHQLSGWGVVNAEAASGPEALAALRTAATDGQPFALALLDLQMPGMDGLELARTIKADPGIAATRLVMLTSLGTRFDEAARRSAGLDACLFKPVRQCRLFESMSQSMAEAASAPPRLVTAQARPGDGVPLRILLAEDNGVNQMVALAQLRKLGYQASVAENGRIALQAQLRDAFDVILMDCQMPEMEGYEACRRIRDVERADPKRKRAHIIALTAHALEGDREKCLAAGMDDYVTKPVDVSALGAALRRAAPKLHESGRRR